MKSYDDLQRFKEKTQTNHIEFKDMSEQTRNADNTDWAIIRQLMSDESSLGNGQRIDVAAPQPVAADLFSKTNAEAARVATPSAAAPASVAAFVAAKPAAQGGSLLDSISASLKPAVQPVAVAVEPAPLSATEPEKRPLLNAQPSIPASPQNASLLDAVRAEPPSFSAPAAARDTRFKPLFSTTGARAVEALPKETPLQPLLEKIALCR